jgi:hypothetical protein
MKKSINLRMSFSAGGAKRNIKTTITKDGKVVNPAELSEEQIAFCAKIAANKARRLSRSVIGFASEEKFPKELVITKSMNIKGSLDNEVNSFTLNKGDILKYERTVYGNNFAIYTCNDVEFDLSKGIIDDLLSESKVEIRKFASEEITVELPEDTDPAKIEAYVDAEVDRAVDESGLTIEAEVEAEDFIDPLEDDNKDAQEVATTETEDAAEVVASQATIAEDAATAATEVAKASTDTKETREVTEKFARKGTQVRVFASADSTRQVRNEFFSKLKRGDY